MSDFNGADAPFPTGVSAIFIFTAAYKNHKSSPSIIVTQSIIPVNSIVCVCDSASVCLLKGDPMEKICGRDHSRRRHFRNGVTR
jgi:hypothetical protein